MIDAEHPRDLSTGRAGVGIVEQLAIAADLEADPANRHVIDVTVRLAKAFAKRTVAEGVEDEQTLETLRELGVDQL